MRDPTIKNIVFREEAILEELKSLKECKSPGPDEIPAKLLFELAQQLAKPLSFLYQKSFDAGIVPTDWKTAHITPLYKSGSRALATNYRPVSLTSICCKVMEKTKKKELMAYLETHNLLSNTQQLRGDMIQTFRIVRGLDCALRRDDFFQLATTTHLRVHPFKLRVPQARLNDLAVETIELLLGEKYDKKENRLGHAQIIQLLKFCLKTCFTFDGTIHEQVKRTPMGSPSSGLIAEAVLQQQESLVFRHERPKFSARYVDDTFVVIERFQVLTFKDHLNAVFPDIQLTMEEKENSQLAFLDVLFCLKECGGLKTRVSRKATNTTQILNFNSNHPISHECSS
nr:unnamed protein product [Spirometra erinaceieuropaei]